MSNEPVAWVLEWTHSGEVLERRLYDDETHCRFDAGQDGGVCRPLIYGDAPRVDDTALLRQALQALKEARAVDCGCPWLDHWNDAITALRERLGEKT